MNYFASLSFEITSARTLIWISGELDNMPAAGDESMVFQSVTLAASG
jgi:hypothetical protein